MKYVSYPRIEPSSMKWLDEVPCNWRLMRIKYIFKERDERSVSGDEELFSLSKEKGLVPRTQITDKEARADTLIGYKKFYPGDVVMNKMQAWNGVFGYSTNACGIVSPEYTVLQPIKPMSTNGAYFSHLFRTNLYASYFACSARGMGTAFLRLNTDDLGSIHALVPSKKEQDSIASFLDCETAKLDQLVDKKQHLIDLLQDKRQAIINQVVTRGLDSTVPMKDSGITWLGEIPAHWTMKKVKHVIDFVTSGSRGWAQYYSDEGDLFIRVGNISRQKTIELDLSDVQYVSPPAGSEGERTKVKPEDVLVAITGATIGSVAIVPEGLDTAYVNQHTALVRPHKEDVAPRWLAFSLMAGYTQTLIDLLSRGGTKEGLSLEDVRDFTLLLPPRDEQELIVNNIDRINSTIEKVLSKLYRQIERLHEYRRALIFTAVTGQIDIREYRTNAEVLTS